MQSAATSMERIPPGPVERRRKALPLYISLYKCISPSILRPPHPFLGLVPACSCGFSHLCFRACTRRCVSCCPRVFPCSYSRAFPLSFSPYLSFPHSPSHPLFSSWLLACGCPLFCFRERGLRAFGYSYRRAVRAFGA